MAIVDNTLNEINIVTLNCWGLKYVSKLRRERLTEIGRQLAIAEPQPHIVALQECFTQEDYLSIRRQTRFILPYGKYYHSAALGGGLAILSRWPIEESSMYRYPLNGRPTAFWRGDWYVGKGVACAKIRGPKPNQVIEVFNTHTHAPYEHGKPDDSYLCHRIAQSWEMAKLLRGAAERGHLVLALGDFNMIPMSLEHQLITALAPVRDVWRVLHPYSSLGPATDPAEKARHRPVPTAEFNIRENGATSDGPYNTWRWSKAKQKLLGPGKPPVVVPPDTPDPRGKRLDYIFASSGDIYANGGGWVVKRASVGMMMRHPELGCSLSDHFAVEATLVFEPFRAAPDSASAKSDGKINGSSNPLPNPSSPLQSSAAIPASKQQQHDNTALVHDGIYLSSPTTPSSTHTPNPNTSDHDHHPRRPESPAAQLDFFLSQQQQQQQQQPWSPDARRLPPHAYEAILEQVRIYTARERSQRRWRAVHFFASVAATAACAAGVWFVPRNYVAFILLLVSSLSLVAGAVDGLMAMLFFTAELKALREFEWEVRNARRRAAGCGEEVPRGGEEEDGDNGEDEGW